MEDTVCWIRTVGYDAADASLQATYDAVRGRSGALDNLYQAFSLRPKTIYPADQLYRAALHDDCNSLPKQLSELVGSYVAILTGCDYALAHHGRNYVHLHGDATEAEGILERLRAGEIDGCGEPRDVATLAFARKLCMTPDRMRREDVAILREHGWSDGEVLEVVQVVAMFSYFTRVINALGISLDGERLGFY